LLAAAITNLIRLLALRIAAASSSVTRGLLAARSCSSSVLVGPLRPTGA
jgi:hypothetical protein